jgi:hypothetical protein
MNGSVAGGWSFVIAAYVITIVALTIYSLQLVARYRKGTRDEQ